MAHTFTIGEQSLQDFQTTFRGALITPDHKTYDECRALYNGSEDNAKKMIAPLLNKVPEPILNRLLPLPDPAILILGIDPEPEKADELKYWSRNYRKSLSPFNGHGAYINFMMEEGEERIKAFYGDNYDRLIEIKRKYDPEILPGKPEY